ncbi:MAG: hypothetical protein BIFFINMI_00743 [Phycisphaerae bacterium]|nr:hypothetical protein [Phycisphaerae bacterium]
MNRLIKWALTATAGLLLAVPFAALAADEAPATDAPKTDAPRRPAARPGGDRAMVGLFEGMNLTEDQMAKVREALKNVRENDPNVAKRQELRQQISDAEKAGDKAKVEELRKQMEELTPKPGELGSKMSEAVKPLLTEEQFKQFQANLEKATAGRNQRPGMRGGSFQELLGQLNLTDDQKSKIEELNKALREAMGKATTPEARRDLMQKHEADVKALLTDEQKTKLAELQKKAQDERGQAMIDRLKTGLSLTDEQVAKVTDLQNALRDAMSKADTPEARRDLFQKYQTDVKALLTDEQKTKYDQLNTRRPGGDRGTRPNRGNRGGRGGARTGGGADQNTN